MKKKIALHIVIIILLSIPLFFMFKAWANLNQSSSPMYTYETVTATEPRVYVTNYGNHYHSPSCGSLWNSKIAMGKQEAISKGYTACSKCGGKPSGTIQTTYKKKVEKDVNSAGFIVGYIFLGLLVAAAIDGIAYGCIYAYRENHPKLTAVSTGNSPITNSIDSSNIFTKKLQPTPSTSPPKSNCSSPCWLCCFS